MLLKWRAFLCSVELRWPPRWNDQQGARALLGSDKKDGECKYFPGTTPEPKTMLVLLADSNRFCYLSRIREASDFLFREHLFSIQGDVKDTVASGNKSCIQVEVLFQFSGYTSCCWFVISH